ncbi:MAG: DUF6089 family protein [Saprospiraceae bacterium]|nr:DUF6089 family protein [Saprospiraceae bacterium]
MRLMKLTLGLALMILPLFAVAQKHWEVSAGVGAMNYYGDLTPPLFTIKEVHLGGQLSVRRFFDRQHAVRLNLLHGKLSGSDRNFDRNYLRGNSFEGQLSEISIIGEFDVRGHKRFSKKHGFQKISSLYFFGGGSVAYFNPVVKYGTSDSRDEEIDYINWHVGMPIGGGVRIDMNERIVLGIELAYRFTISDFLDGTQATGNAYKNDSYTFGGAWIGYRFMDKEEAEAPVKGK